MDFLNQIKRGIVQVHCEEELVKKLNSGKKMRLKLGVDPTSPDLHLGHTVLLRKLRLFQDQGHTVVFIIGDFTAQIGDPSGQSQTRPILSEEQISNNAKTYQEQVFKILDKSKTEVVYNSTWLKELGIKGLLNLAAKQTVARMLERDDFSQRFKSSTPITILEFLYPLLQGYDSVAIKSDIEFGGNDQLFNVLMGRQMQSDFGQESQIVITLPLLVGTDGVKKMSKSYQNYIALNDTPKDMFGKIMSIADSAMYSYFELLTDFDLVQIKSEIQNSPRDTKVKLAKHITAFYHGEDSAQKAADEFDKVFSKREVPEDMPVFKTEVEKWRLTDLLVSAKLAPSKNEARRLITQKAVEIDGAIITEDSSIILDKPIIVRAGKRRFCKVIKI